MKHLRKTFVMFFLGLLCMLVLPATAQAASKAPAKVKITKATAGESQVTLRWNRISNASGYYVYRLDTKTNTYKKIKTIKQPKTSYVTYTVKKLTNNRKYTYKVSAYRKLRSKTYEGKQSNPVSVTPQVKKPGTTKLNVTKAANTKVTMKWNKAANATGYEIFQKNKSGKYISIGTTKKTAIVISKLENGKNYSFKVRAYRKIGGLTRYGNFSSTQNVKPVAIDSTVTSIRSMNYKAKVTGTVRARVEDSSKYVTVKAGTSVTVLERGSTCLVKLKNGTRVKISSGYLSYQSCIIESKDYSKNTKEAFVNSKGYSSPTDYMIWISLPKQRLYVFKGKQFNWKLIKTFKCSTGKVNSPTPPGRYRIIRKSPLFWFDEDCYAKYASFFSGNAIHGWLLTPGDVVYNDGNLGSPASHGCVRVGKNSHGSEALYIYNTVPMGSTCLIY